MCKPHKDERGIKRVCYKGLKVPRSSREVPHDDE